MTLAEVRKTLPHGEINGWSIFLDSVEGVVKEMKELTTPDMGNYDLAHRGDLEDWIKRLEGA